GVNRRRVVGGEETVGHQTTGSVQNEDLERGLAEGVAFRTHSFGQLTYQRIDLLDVVVIQALQVCQRFRVRGQVLKLGDGVQANLTTELVVAGNTTLTVTQDVDGGQVDGANARQRQVPQEVREVVQGQRTWVGDTEGVPQASRAFLIQEVFRVTEGSVLNRNDLARTVRANVINFDFVTQEGVHPVNRDELFGQRVIDTEILWRGRANQTGKGVVDLIVALEQLGQAWIEAEDLLEVGIGLFEVLHDLANFVVVPVTRCLGAQQTPPVGIHNAFADLVGDNGRRPLNRVDLGDQRGNDQTGFVIQPLVALARILGCQHFGNGVVFLGEELMQHAQTHPPVFIEAGDRDIGVHVGRQGAVRVELQLTTREATQLVGGRFVATVHLGSIPPMGVDVLEGGGQMCVSSRASGVRDGATDFHGARTQGIAGRQRNADVVVGFAWAVIEPVMHLELNPRANHEVYAGGGLELITRHQHVT